MAHSQVLYKLFEENVAPVLMIFHKPCLLKMIFKAAGNIDNLDPPSEAVVFAVYFAAINSMDPKRCPELLSQDHSFLLERYRFATQQALARAGLLQLRNQMVLQAAVLFLTCLRRPEDAHFVWTMTAAVLRAAQGIGLHRDGTNFGLSPFEVEMRRRLWWSIYLLDSQSSELQAIDKQITEDSYDTRMPLNINDSDLSPDMTQLPEPRSSFTEMTFCLVRIEMIVLYSRSALSAVGDRNYSNSRGGNQDGSLVLEERLRQLGQIINRLREQYLKFCDTSVPVQWVTATIIRLALARSWLVAHFSRDVNAEGMPAIETPADDPSRDQLFAAATEVVEFALLLETDPRTMNWSWFFRGYPQWHAVMFVLSELLIRSRAADTDRAWAMVNRAVARWMERDARKGSIVFETVYHLMIRAAAAHNRVWHGPRNGDADELWTVPWESM